MDAEQLVRALADADGPVAYEEADDWTRCLLCNAEGPAKRFGGPSFLDETSHHPTCPWRLAREWVKEHDPPGF
jgi:hypothetical protein